MKKKLLATLLSVFMMLGTITNFVHANETKKIEDILPAGFPTTEDSAWVNAAGYKVYLDSNNQILKAYDGGIDITSYLDYIDNKYTISGSMLTWEFVLNGDGKLEKLIASGGQFMYESCNGEYTAVPVAQIGDTKYGTLQAAIDAVNDGEEITVINDITCGTPITINNGKTFTINFNDGTSQHTFTWADSDATPHRDKDIFTIKGNSNVTVKNMQYKIGSDEYGNRIFKVESTEESTGTLTLIDMIADNIKDTPVRNNGGTVIIDGGNITTYQTDVSASDYQNVFNPIVQNFGGTTTFIGNGTYTINSQSGIAGAVWLGNIITKNNTDANPNNNCGTVIIENGTFNNGTIITANGKGSVTINNATHNADTTKLTASTMLIYHGGTKSKIVVNNITSSTNMFAFVYEALDTKIDFQNGNVKYKANQFCYGPGASSKLVSIKNGKFGLSTGTTDIKSEIEGFLANGSAIVKLTDDSDGYTYKVEIPPTCRIDSTRYATLAEAIAHVPKDGTKTTITMIADETFADNATMAIAANQNIVLDLNGKTITGKNLKTSTWAFLTNNGTLTITDNSDNANGKITSSTQPETDGYAGHYTVLNKNVLVLEKGTIEETSEKVGGGNNLKWALRNEASANQTVSLTINGGNVVGEYNAVSNYVYDNTSVCNFTVNGGSVITNGRFSPVTMQIAGGTKPNCNISINGGEFIVKNIRNKNTDGNAVIYCDDQNTSVTDTSNIKIDIAGGKFNTYNTGMIVQFDDFKPETVKPSKYMSAGIMNVPDDYANIENNEVASGYKIVENDDVSTKTNYPYKIGKRTSSDSNKVVVTGNDDVPNYYGETAELKDAVNNIIESNQEKEDNNKAVNITTITVDNSDGINAEIDDTIVIVAKKNNANTVTGVVGYNIEKEDNNTNNTTTYKAKALNVGEHVENGVIKIDGTGKKDSKKEDTIYTKKDGVSISQLVFDSAGTVTDTTDNKYLQQIVAEIVASNTEMAKLKLNQATAAKAINKDENANKKVTTDGSGSNEVAAKDVSIFVKTYYDTVITEDKTTETNKSFKFDIKPMYQAFASTASDISQMNASGVTTVAMGEAKELDNLRGKKITLTFTLPAGFVDDVNQKVYVIHTLTDGTKKTYDSRITKNGSNFDISFDNADGFSVFEFTLDNPNPTVDPAPKPKSTYSVPKTGIN